MVEHLKPFNIFSVKKILSQMEYSFYNIHLQEGKMEIGVFCYIKYKDQKIPVLITRNTILYEKYYKSINIHSNNGEKNIELGDIRYENKECNLAIIEIKE